MKNVLSLLALLFPLSVIADGWSDVRGTNSQGAVVSVYPSQLTNADYDWKDGAGIPKPGALSNYDISVKLGGTYQKYERQKCDFEERDGVRTHFLCATTGTSPLSGTTYKIVPNPKENDCSYESTFVCIKGCDGKETPKEMRKSWWECDV